MSSVVKISKIEIVNPPPIHIHTHRYIQIQLALGQGCRLYLLSAIPLSDFRLLNSLQEPIFTVFNYFNSGLHHVDSFDF